MDAEWNWDQPTNQMSPPHSQRSAPKAACLTCRKRKARCDGMRPACTKCHSLGRAGSCEYDDLQGMAETQKLESSIARLEARILHLGGTLPTSSEVIVHEPQLDSGGYGRVAGSSFSAWSSNQHLRPQSRQSGAPLQVALPDNWWRAAIPPAAITKMLIDTFSRHASQLGFFLSGRRILTFFPPDPRRPMSPSLLNAMLLLGIHLSGALPLKEREAVFLERAMQATAPMQPFHAIQNVQAETLLAHYFFRQGRFLEAMHRINSAVSLAIGCGLHRHSGAGGALPPTRDAVEQGERVNAFWTVLTIHKTFSVMMKWPSSLSDILDESIDAPWPLDMDVYESGLIPHSQPGPTLKTFMYNPMVGVGQGSNSCLSQFTKAAALFEAAHHIGRHYNLSDAQEYADFLVFEHGLVHFMQTLAPINAAPASLDTMRQRLVTFTLCQAAVILLHSHLDSPEAAAKSFGAARAVVEVNKSVPNMSAWGCIDAIMGTLWKSVAEVFMRALVADSRSRTASVDHNGLKTGFASILGTMEMFSPRCQLIDYQASTLRELYKTSFR